MEKTVAVTTDRKTLGDDRVRVCISLPALPEEAKTPLAKGFSAYYGGMRTGFLRFAEKTLLPRAEGECAPFGAVLKATVSFENENLLSVYVDAAVSTDAGQRRVRLPQIWDRKRGVLIRAERVFKKNAAKLLMPALEAAAEARAESAAVRLYADWRERLISRFDKRAFYICPHGLAFIYGASVLSDKNEIFPVYISAEDASAVLKDSVASFFWGNE